MGAERGARGLRRLEVGSGRMEAWRDRYVVIFCFHVKKCLLPRLISVK